MSTPSAVTNKLIEALRQLNPVAPPQSWSEAHEQLRQLRDSELQSRQQLGERASQRGPAFLQEAEAPLKRVAAAYDHHEGLLDRLLCLTAAPTDQSFVKDVEAFAESTRMLYQELENYGRFHFSWGENQSPLVSMIRQQVESYSRAAVQSSHAQRVVPNEDSASPARRSLPPGFGR